MTLSGPDTALPRDKSLSADDVVARLEDGMTIGIGGWGSRRKPMALVRAIARSNLRDLTVVSYGGPDVGILCAAGKVREVVFAFVSLDVIALEPWFRQARESGAITCRELDEGMMLLGLQAAAWRVPFLPTRAGLGSDLFRIDPSLRTVRSPYPDAQGEAEELVAVPALNLDAALVHVHRSDRRGNGVLLDDDPYFDTLFLGAAQQHRYLSCEELVEPAELTKGSSFHALAISRLQVDGVVHVPGGSHPTSCEPLQARDNAHLKVYAAAAGQEAGWAGYAQTYLGSDESDYQRRVAAAATGGN